MSNGSINLFTDCTSCKPQASFKKCARSLGVIPDTLMESNFYLKLLLESEKTLGITGRSTSTTKILPYP